MMVAIHFAIILSLSWVIFKKYASQYPLVFWLALSFKLLMGSALGLVYIYYYTANDTWLFFHDANVLADLARNDFTGYLKFLMTDSATGEMINQLINSQERSLFLIKIMSIFSWTGGNNYWVSAAWFSFISFLAAWYLFLTITSQFERSSVAAAFSFLFFPSIIFWSSGLVKETMALAGIYFISGFLLKFIFNQKSKWFEWIFAFFSFWVAWNLKYYWTALFGAILFTYVVVYMLSKRAAIVQKNKIVVWLLIFTLLSGMVSLLHPNFHLNRFLDVLITNHNDFVRISDDDGLIHFHRLQASWETVVLNAPWALFSGLLRPVIWETTGLMSLLASFENLLITILIVTALSRVFKIHENRLLLFSVVMYITLLCIFLALSTPNLGTLSRYRVGFLPFLIFIISYQNPVVTYFSNRIQT